MRAHRDKEGPRHRSSLGFPSTRSREHNERTSHARDARCLDKTSASPLDEKKFHKYFLIPTTTRGGDTQATQKKSPALPPPSVSAPCIFTPTTTPPPP